MNAKSIGLQDRGSCLTADTMIEKNMNRRLRCVLFFFALCMLVMPLNAMELSLGIELLELQQNNFSESFTRNYTVHCGFLIQIDDATAWGIRYSGIDVDLSEEYLKEPSFAYQGDFSHVTGKLNVHRILVTPIYTSIPMGECSIG